MNVKSRIDLVTRLGYQREEKTREQLEQEQKAAEEAVKGLPPDQIFVLQSVHGKSIGPIDMSIHFPMLSHQAEGQI